jgi:SanA protein
MVRNVAFAESDHPETSPTPMKHCVGRGAAGGAALFALLAAVAGAKIAIYRATRGRTYQDTDAIPHRPVGLVLGCAPRLRDGGVNPFFANRITAAAQLHFAGKIDYLLVSGSSEVGEMRNALVQCGVPAERIHCDSAGYRTLDSVIRAKEVFGQTEIIVISQEFHNRRAIFIAKHSGLDAIGFKAADVRVCNSMKTRLREQLARVRTVIDVLVLHRRPKSLGEKISKEGEAGEMGLNVF